MESTVGSSATDEARKSFYKSIDAENMTPLWEVLANLVPKEPYTPCVPCHWRWSTTRARLVQAGGLISAAEAERRVLVLENPGLRGASSITHSLYAGVQLLLPGESAPPHRHTATAVRFIMEGEGAFTSVDGERMPMSVGDFVITPSWTFHDHENPGSESVFWLDGLDVPIVKMFDAAFLEHGPASAPVKSTDMDHPATYAGDLMPVANRTRVVDPVFRYPYEQARSTLSFMKVNGPLHPAHGIRLRYSQPGVGGWPTPTIGAFIQLLPKGFEGSPYRSTDATVFCVVEGSGHSLIGERRIDWGPRDVFMVPSWVDARHIANEESVLFSMSDRPAQLALGIWREALQA